jgi:uncharacterized protein YkwD
MPNSLNRGSFDRATPINATQSFSDRVGKSNPIDLFRLSLSDSIRLSLKGKSSGQGAQVQLIQDRNQNGQIDRGETLKSFVLRRGNAKQGSLSQDLVAGTYFVQVTGGKRGLTQYRLSLDSAAQTGITPSANGFARRVVDLTNAFRNQNGLAALTVNSKLTAVAQSYSQTMAIGDFVEHRGLDGSQPWDRMTAGGYKWSRSAENIAAGQNTPEEVVQGWISSPGHRANLLNANLKDIGVGYYFLANDTGRANYNHYWTQNFGTPA